MIFSLTHTHRHTQVLFFLFKYVFDFRGRAPDFLSVVAGVLGGRALELVIPSQTPALRVQGGKRRVAPHIRQHACRQLAEAVGLLQDAVVHALARRRGDVPQRSALGLGYDAGEVGRASLCKLMVLQGRGR